jgi:hypothetical protein
MNASKLREEMPERFESLDAAADWWDKHSLADYEDLTQPASFEIALDRGNRTIKIDRELSEELRTIARKQGTTVQALIDQWIRERLHYAAPAS